MMPLRGSCLLMMQATEHSIHVGVGLRPGFIRPQARFTGTEFTSFSRSLRPESPDSMDGAPLLRAPLWPVCRPDSCPHCLTPQAFAYFQRLHAFFLEVILRKGPKPTALSEEPLVLEFRSPTALPYHVAVAYSTRKKPIQAALLELKELDDDSAPPDICQVLACEKSLDGHLTLKSDVQVCVHCATKAEDWRISVLGVGPVKRLSHFDILWKEAVERKSLERTMDEEKKLKLAVSALKALNKKPLPKKRAARPSLASSFAKMARRDMSPSPSHGGSSQSDSGTDNELEAAPEAKPSEPGLGPPARSTEVERETGSAMPSEPALGPLAAPRPKVRHNVRRASVWGTNPSFQIAPIHAAGSKEPTGWGAICGRHTDTNRPGLQCKKAMSKSGLSDAECQLRLKRWLVSGLDATSWGSNKRDCHVSMGGIQLAQFADGLDSEALDALVGHVA